MRYPAAEKVEIIRLVEASHLPARRTLDQLGIPRATFYRWYDRYRDSGPEALGDRRSRPDRVWNRMPEAIRDEIIDLALTLTDLSPRAFGLPPEKWSSLRYGFWPWRTEECQGSDIRLRRSSPSCGRLMC